MIKERMIFLEQEPYGALNKLPAASMTARSASCEAKLDCAPSRKCAPLVASSFVFWAGCRMGFQGFLIGRGVDK